MPFQSPPVYDHTELLPNPCDKFGHRERRRCGALLEDEIQHSRRKFVRSVRAALARNQSREALLRNRLLGLIERRARQSERRCSFGHGRFVDLDAAKHLVLDLQQIVGVEEVSCLEQRLGDGLRMWMEDALLAKSLHLCGISPGHWHGKSGQLLCIYNYAAYQISVKCPLRDCKIVHARLR